MSDDQVTIEIDGRAYRARKGSMLIQVADANGIHIPRFCYHRKLSVAANCRMCLVEVEKAPKPLPACATPVMDGMKVFTRSRVAIDAQRSVMEFLLVNHPLDCPICDQGGECELQDVAMGFGGDISRFNERKRVVKDKDIGPLIATDMTRCIHCTRCVRFGEEIAGMRELGATGRGEHTEIGTYIARSVDSELSGNVIDLCPVGALTSKPARFSARAWEMTQRAGIAAHDGVGSNIHMHLARGRVMRVVPRDNEELNESWLSDRDRYSYTGLYSDDRLLRPAVRKDGSWQDTDWETALNFAVTRIKNVVGSQGAEQLGALASASCTTEELYLLQKLVRGLGSANLDHRLARNDFSDQDSEPAYPVLGQPLAALEQADAVLLVGSLVRKEQPLINHRIRKAALAGARVMVVNSVDPQLNYPADSVLVDPNGMVDTLAALAKALGAKAEGSLGKLVAGATASPQAKAWAKLLKDARSPAVLLGTMALAGDNLSALRALGGLIAGASGATLGYLAAGANAAGAALAGMLPHRGPAAQPVTAGLHAAAMFEQGLAAYLLLGIEPDLDCANPSLAAAALDKAETVIALTAFDSDSLRAQADVLLPIAQFAETSGSYVNAEGRWQRFEGALAPPGEARPAWKLLRVLGNLFELDGFDYNASGEVLDELSGPAADLASDTRQAWSSAVSNGQHNGMVRIGATPIYAVDGLVRRAGPLQHTVDAVHVARAHICSADAQRLGLADGDRAELRQGDASAVLDVTVDERVAAGCVLVHAGVAGSETLGASYGAIALSKAGD